MPLINLKRKLPKIAKIILFFLVLYICEILLTYVFIKDRLYSESHSFLEDISTRIYNDLKYKDNTLDTSAYIADPLTAFPNYSSVYPVYIVTSDGFVFERSKPINGYMDTSNYKYLSDFKTPQNLTTPTKENWRVLSRGIQDPESKETIGVITVSYYNPRTGFETYIDKVLQDNLNQLESLITITNGEINVSKINRTHYEVSFEIVSRFNKLLLNNGRTPSYIDASYILEAFQTSSTQVIIDSVSNEEYMIRKRIILDENGQESAIIIVGRSMSSSNELMSTLFSFSAILEMIISLPLSLIILILLKTDIKYLFFSNNDNSSKSISRIIFDRKSSIISVNDRKVSIPFDTNQYYLCKALFSNLDKKWEQDELLEEFGEDFSSTNSRKIYDAALAINKKLDIKLIDYSNKTYSINKLYHYAVSESK